MCGHYIEGNGGVANMIALEASCYLRLNVESVANDKQGVFNGGPAGGRGKWCGFESNLVMRANKDVRVHASGRVYYAH